MQVADRRVQALRNGGDAHLTLQHRVGVVEHRVHRMCGVAVAPAHHRWSRHDVVPLGRDSLVSLFFSLDPHQLQPLSATLGQQGTESQLGWFCTMGLIWRELRRKQSLAGDRLLRALESPWCALANRGTLPY